MEGSAKSPATSVVFAVNPNSASDTDLACRTLNSRAVSVDVSANQLPTTILGLAVARSIWLLLWISNFFHENGTDPSLIRSGMLVFAVLVARVKRLGFAALLPNKPTFCRKAKIFAVVHEPEKLLI